MAIKIHLAGHLGRYTEGKVEFDFTQAADVHHLVIHLGEMFPAVRDKIFDEHDRTRPFVNIFVNEENIRDLDSEQTPVKNGDEVYILPSVAGGSGEKSRIGS